MESVLNKISWLCLLWLLLQACTKEPVDTIYLEPGKKSGVFITCEGNFMYGNASLSFYDKESNHVYNQVFFARNRAPLGDVAQSVTSDGKNLYIVVNNSGKIVVADPVTLEFKGVISGLVSPRYIHFIGNDKAYVSDLYARRITVFDTSSLMKTGFISVSDGQADSPRHATEIFVQAGNEVFVSCWYYDNKILVIDPVADTVIDSLTVPMQPKKMVADIHNKLWVLTDGSYPGAPGGHELPSLVRIDPATRTVEQIFRWTGDKTFPGDLRLNPAKDSLYLMAGSIYRFSVTARKLPDKPFIDAGSRMFYSMGVDPVTGEVYVADAIDYMQNAIIYRYLPSGDLVGSFRAGINPGDYYFNY